MKAIVSTDFKLEGMKSKYVGKVRDVYDLGDYLAMVVSDRISALWSCRRVSLIRDRYSIR